MRSLYKYLYYNCRTRPRGVLQALGNQDAAVYVLFFFVFFSLELELLIVNYRDVASSVMYINQHCSA